MHPDESLGLDGLNPVFFKKFWDMIGAEVVASCQTWFDQLFIPKTVSDTTIILIPKENNLETVRDLRPILLCNV